MSGASVCSAHSRQTKFAGTHVGGSQSWRKSRRRFFSEALQNSDLMAKPNVLQLQSTLAFHQR
jgi:hypothetical protein